jgi:DNA (cytosine-5)-methyltransferase 1
VRTSLRHRHADDQHALDEFLARVLADAAGRPILIDFYCCQGGATRGYQDAGFYVLGADLSPQPRYCGQAFIQGDAVALIAATAVWAQAVGAVFHASPPCQRYSLTQRIRGNDHPDLIGPTRDALNATGRPWVIENVMEARPELIDPIRLCGAMFPGLNTYRHRLFESGGGLVLEEPGHPDHPDQTVKMGRPLDGARDFYHAVGHFSGVPYVRENMRVPWMNRDGISECIPPAYAELIGRQFAEHLAAMAVAA